MRYPDTAPADALPHLGADRQLIQGINESDASFRTRCKDPWGQWSRAGTACGVLEQLYYFGLTGATWVQQNGLQYTLSGAPTPGQDPTGLVVASNTSASPIVLSSSASPYRTIPATTPWWWLGTNTDLCNRFAIIVNPWPFSAFTTAYFNNSDSAVVTWPFPFPDNGYGIVYGMPSAPVVLSVDGAATTTTQATIRSTGSWTGSVPVIAWGAGVNPLNTFSLSSLGTLQRIISTFRPNAICQGVYAYQLGHQWGNWTWGSGSWGGAVSQILGAF